MKKNFKIFLELLGRIIHYEFLLTIFFLIKIGTLWLFGLDFLFKQFILIGPPVIFVVACIMPFVLGEKIKTKGLM